MELVEPLLQKASAVFARHFPPRTSFAKCFFLSWYCSLGDCTFCYRSTVKNKIAHPEQARRTKSSIYAEAFVAKQLGWDIEFLTGGYGIYPVEDLVEITRTVSLIYGEKVWINFGVMSKPTLDKFRPYVKGVVASIETINPALRARVCPSKPLDAYLALYRFAGSDLLKSCAFIVGIGETPDDIVAFHNFIRDNHLARITIYALHPVKGTPFTHGPPLDYYLWWIAKTRIVFPTLDIVAGIPVDGRGTDLILRAGANTVTKFPIMRKFATPAAQRLEEDLQRSGRSFPCTFTRVPDINWAREIDMLPLDGENKEKIRGALPNYLARLRKRAPSIPLVYIHS